MIKFRDEAIYDSETRTALTVRDGVLEYLGAEIGQEPSDKLFTVYRSPATIAKIAEKMKGLPITDEHVEPQRGVAPSSPIGTIEGVDIVDLNDMATSSMLALKNTLSFTQEVPSDKREFSLGYFGDLKPHDKYDFEQFDLEPHHLAIVEAGRCGSVCSFLDHKKKEKTEVITFIDADGNVSLEKIIEVAKLLPEALAKVPVSQVEEILPSLQAIVEASKGVMPEAEAVEEVADEDTVTEEVEVMDEDVEEDKKMAVTDSKAFKDALKSALDKHTEVIVKAKQFVEDTYVFSDKSTAQIMRDSLAMEHNGVEFKDEELDVAFKLLKKSENYQNFGDASVKSKLSDLKDKEL